MKIKVTMSKTIRVQEDKRYLEMTFKGLELENFDTNLPYEKSIDDWAFYQRAIRTILKELTK